MSGAPARGTAPRRPRRHHKHQRQTESETEPEVQRPKVNPIFLWASQREQRIVEVRCEDYDKRNRIKLTKTAQGWRSIPRTASSMYPCTVKCSNSAENGTKTAQNRPRSRNRKKENDGNESVQNELDRDRISTHPQRTQITNGCQNASRTRKDPPDAVRLQTDQIRKNELERVRMDQLLQPRVVLEQLHLSQLPDSLHSGHQSLLEHMEREHGGDKPPEVDKEDLQEILNMLDATASPAMAIDTPSADLPSPNASKTCNNFERGLTGSSINIEGFPEIDTSSIETAEHEVSGQQESTDPSSVRTTVENTERYSIVHEIDQSRSPRRAHEVPPSYKEFATRKVLRDGTGRDQNQDLKEEQVPTLPCVMLAKQQKDHSKNKDTPAFERESGVHDTGVNSRNEVNSLLKWRNAMVMAPVIPNIEQNCRNIDGKDDDATDKSVGDDFSSKILNALRNTPGLSVSIAKKNNSENNNSDTPNFTSNDSPSQDHAKSSLIVTKAAAAANVNHASSTNPGQRKPPLGLLISIPNGETHSQNASKTVKSVPLGGSTVNGNKPDQLSGTNCDSNQCLENVSENARSQTHSQISPRNLPGLSITIPSYQYRSKHMSSSLTSSPIKRHIDSPESTVTFTFPKLEGNAKLSLSDVITEEDDHDSQVLEDLRKHTDSFSSRSKTSDVSAPYKRFLGHVERLEHFDDQMLENRRSHGTLVSQSGLFSPHGKISNEASMKYNRYQDLEHFDEQVLEDLRSQGTVVSPQPSGIPCSPAPRRASSAYLERLLPSPPCSVSCSEDAKNDLTLKGILASPDKSFDCEKIRIPGKDHENENEDVPNHLPDHDVKTLNCVASSKRPALRGSSANDHKTAAHQMNRFHGDEVGNFGRPMSSGDIHSTFFSEYTFPKRPMSVEWTTSQQKPSQISRNFVRGIKKPRIYVPGDTEKIKDPATQLRELIKKCGHFIPDPLLVPRDHLPALAAAPATQIPKLLASRPELRLPEALTRPELLRDPDLLVISLAHLQHVLDHGEGPVSRSHMQSQNKRNSHSSDSQIADPQNSKQPKLTCKPIGTLMPAPIDLSANRRAGPYPYSYPPLLRVRSGLLKQEPEVTSTGGSPEDSQLWHPLFSSQKRQEQHQASWHRTTLAS